MLMHSRFCQSLPRSQAGCRCIPSIQSVSFTEVFTPKDIDLENDEEMDDDERELEAFKRFCLQSVPPLHKEKVNLNIKDIVLKKKSSSSSSSSSSTSSSAAAAAVIAAN